MESPDNRAFLFIYNPSFPPTTHYRDNIIVLDKVVGGGFNSAYNFSDKETGSIQFQGYLDRE